MGFSERLGDEGRLWDSIAIRGVRFAFADHVPDSGQEHATNCDDGFLVAPASFDAAVTDTELGVILGPSFMSFCAFRAAERNGHKNEGAYFHILAGSDMKWRQFHYNLIAPNLDGEGAVIANLFRGTCAV